MFVKSARCGSMIMVIIGRAKVTEPFLFHRIFVFYVKFQLTFVYSFECVGKIEQRLDSVLLCSQIHDRFQLKEVPLFA